MTLLATYFTDGDFSKPYMVSSPRFSQPFEGDSGEYVLEQDFWIHEKYFAPLALNTPHESTNGDPSLSYGNYVLVKESPTTKVGNGIVSWTRTYAALPASRNDTTTIAYTFIGFLGVLVPTTYVGNPTIPPGRPQFTKVVKCRVQNDYFITLNNVPSQLASTLGAGSVATATQPITALSGTVLLNDASKIPQIPKQAYYLGQGYWSAGPTWTPLFSDPVQAQAHGMSLGAIWDISGALGISGIGVNPQPTRTQYNVWVSNATEIVAEDSQIMRWMGNIYVRQTKYVVAI
jgi:hypothetical protein